MFKTKQAGQYYLDVHISTNRIKAPTNTQPIHCIAMHAGLSTYKCTYGIIAAKRDLTHIL